ncbi:hypothetical protein BDY19DRAFT_930665 [Irpex rosettiformis]|uniref:Uncharacterized protein n=1 Tax=Irpex rosettiformis TaxID=378272 RepID=A0ACB8UBN4_9APHY|nr:hypothetical protein BDY19DRAFT_930665 [Irpex rosettiformis]
MSDPSHPTAAAQVQGRGRYLLNELKAETAEVAKIGGQALSSLTWLWPIRGLLYTVLHPQIILTVKGALVKSLGTSAVVFGVLAFFTYVPQAAALSLITGPLGPILALFLLGAESIFLLSFFAKALFLEPTLQFVFDATLREQGQGQLVKDGKTRSSVLQERGNALLRPIQALSRDGVLRYIITLPINLIPVFGTIAFLCINGHRAGPSWHARYFQLKGLTASQRKAFIERHRAEYTAFGVGALIFSFIPIIGLVFTFTNTVGAALWAAQLEAQSNIIEGPAATEESAKDK